jgi:hypothetical protein
MNGSRITLKPWSDFSQRIEDGCDSIAQHVAKKLGSGKENAKKHNGTYSFIGLVRGHPKTVAKLVPQYRDLKPVILVCFSPSLPEPDNYAKQISSSVERVTIMDEDFFASQISDEWSVEQVAETIGKFLSQAPPGGRRKMEL